MLQRVQTTAPVSPVDVRPAGESPLVVRGLTVAYQHKPVLWDIDYAAPSGALVAVVGPNGAGKSTLIKAALGLVSRLTGEVLVFGETIER